MNVNVCVPVLKRYDMLRKMLESLHGSTVQPKIWIIDNGRVDPQGEKLTRAVASLRQDFHIHVPAEPMGVAASWNWFIDHVPEERIIANDDVEFAQRSLEKMIASPADLVWAEHGFSCFLIRDSCVKKLGKFDEMISPGYAYYEDDDYLQRLDGRGTKPRAASADFVAAGIIHHRSSTLQNCSEEELAEHHRKFKIAQQNYIKKWNISAEEFYKT